MRYEPNEVGVDAGTQEGHSPRGAEGAGFNVNGFEAVFCTKGSDCLAEQGGDGRHPEVTALLGPRKVIVQGRV